MLADHRATAMIPAKDFARAKAWYADKLGLRPVRETEPDIGAAYVLGGGTQAFLYPTQFAGTAQHTLLSFDTPDLAADMKTLRAKGVVFLDYDLPGLKTEDGVASFGPVKNAWCKDSEGNILGFVQGM
ncbi:MAG TPA: VOC family protein [Devosia sp.]|jgi:catechol 2,3-dioxygenase-like lactoylglutathione lyase family enzyme|nr:VOC family protein [Devosia sp.]